MGWLDSIIFAIKRDDITEVTPSLKKYALADDSKESICFF